MFVINRASTATPHLSQCVWERERAIWARSEWKWETNILVYNFLLCCRSASNPRSPCLTTPGTASSAQRKRRTLTSSSWGHGVEGYWDALSWGHVQITSPCTATSLLSCALAGRWTTRSPQTVGRICLEINTDLSYQISSFYWQHESLCLYVIKPLHSIHLIFMMYVGILLCQCLYEMYFISVKGVCKYIYK